MEQRPSGSGRQVRMGKKIATKRRRKTVHEHISQGAIKRLARRGGVKRLSALIYNEMRQVLKIYLDRLIKDSIVYCEYFKRKTVSAEDVIRAMKHRGERLYGFDDPPCPDAIRTSIRITDDTVSTASSIETIALTGSTSNSAQTAPDNTEEPANDLVLNSSDSTVENLELGTSNRSRRAVRSSSRLSRRNDSVPRGDVENAEESGRRNETASGRSDSTVRNLERLNIENDGSLSAQDSNEHFLFDEDVGMSPVFNFDD